MALIYVISYNFFDDIAVISRECTDISEKKLYPPYLNNKTMYYNIGFVDIDFVDILSQITNDWFHTAIIRMRRYWNNLTDSYIYSIKSFKCKINNINKCISINRNNLKGIINSLCKYYYESICI